MADPRQAYYKERYRRNREKILAQQREYAARPESQARKKAYDKLWHARILADPEKRAARYEKQKREYRRRIYGTETPTIGQLSLDGLHRYGTPGRAPMPKPPRPPRVKKVRMKAPKPIPAPKPIAPPKPPAPVWIPKPEGVATVTVTPRKVTYLCWPYGHAFTTQQESRLCEQAHQQAI